MKSPGLAPLKLMLPMLIAAVFPLVRITAFWPLRVPVATAAQLRLEGETALAPVDDPTPESATTCGLLVAESAKLRLAVRVPAAPGRNTTLAMQVPEIARLVPQVVLEIAKSDAFGPVTAMLVILMDAPGPFDNVTDCAGLLVPTNVEENERLAGDADAVAGVVPPTPESATICGLPGAESVKFRLAVRVPEALGLNTSVAEQLAPTERLAPHVLPDTTKSNGLVPVTATPLIVMGDVFPLFSVTDWDAALVPTAVLPKVIDAGLAATTPLVPSPERAIVCGLSPSESWKLRMAVRVPVAVGPNTMFAVQLAPCARVVPQVLLNTVKSPGLAPVKLMLLILMVVRLVFVSVTTFCPLLVPTTTAAQLRLAGDTLAAIASFAPTSADSPSKTSFAVFNFLRRDGSCDEIALTSVPNRPDTGKIGIPSPEGLHPAKNSHSNGMRKLLWLSLGE